MKMFAISSGGGHWEQLMLIRPAFVEFEVNYCNTVPGLAEKQNIRKSYLVTDCNATNPISLLKCFCQLFVLLLNIKPHIIVTTGAAPGLIAILIGKIFGSKTVWIDSVANVERLSLSGRVAKHFADIHLTQWESVRLANNTKTEFIGRIL